MSENESLEKKLYQELSEKHGEMIGGAKLAHVLGYSSSAAFCKALERDTLKLPVFHISGRSGRFALTIDVVHWLINSREQAKFNLPREIPVQLRTKKQKTS